MPATSQLTIPGGSTSGSLDVKLATFQQLLTRAITPAYVEEPLTETVPSILTGVPLK